MEGFGCLEEGNVCAEVIMRAREKVCTQKCVAATCMGSHSRLLCRILILCKTFNNRSQTRIKTACRLALRTVQE